MSIGRHPRCRLNAHPLAAPARIIVLGRPFWGAGATGVQGTPRGMLGGMIEALGGTGRAPGRLQGNAMDDAVPIAAPSLTVRLLGRLEVEIAGVPVRLSGRHAQALAALLILQPRPRLRDAIAADLWPECAGPSASSLRQAVWLVRTGLAGAGVHPEAVLAVEQDTLGIHRSARIELDVWRFEALLDDGPEATRAALAIYRSEEH